MSSDKPGNELEGIAIIGMAGRFPGASDLEEFWDNLSRGVDSIGHFAEAELEPSRLESSGLRALPNYVRARGVLQDVDRFDAAFFGISPREAEVMDPQHRLFLEGAWSALESAGYDPATYPGSIGVWGGMSNSTYYLENLLPRRDVVDQVGAFQVMLGNDRDYLTTRASYKLNLRGPSVSVQTACSTSLVAVCDAFHALAGYQCDMALAGGVSIVLPQRCGYFHNEGGIMSPDGRCRPFDADAAGTVFSNGLGIVVLKRLEDALTDGDFIHAVLRGVALNNDGADKLSFSAPSVNGQADVVMLAHGVAGVEPDTISYVETHGTATPLGDPIEVAALSQAFRAGTNAKQFCALGSVKSNIGHLDAAAGVAGLIKTVLALRHRQLVPSLHFARSNPHIDFDASPFYVNVSCRPWPDGPTPRRAGVSSFGIGGTNAHVVLEEAPNDTRPVSPPCEQVLVLSARTEQALERATARLANHIRSHSELNLADVAYTLQVGRRGFSHRRALVCSSAEDALRVLDGKAPFRLVSGRQEHPAPRVAFLFPGQGAQHAGMAADLYATEPVFAHEFDACARVLDPLLGLDIRALTFAGSSDRGEAERRLAETAITQPVLFAVELALARLWMSWGIEPSVMIGHSLGEYVAACLAGVFSRDQAAVVVATRGRLMQEQPRGAMLAVRLPLASLQPWLTPDVVVAGLNAPELNIASGPEPAVKALEQRLAEHGITCRMLATSHAFHSPMMDGALAAFRDGLDQTPLQRPQRPWISSLTGDWVTAEQAVDPEYWVRQMRQPVRFSDGVKMLLQDPSYLFLEVGPGHGLANLVRAHRDDVRRRHVVTSLERELGTDGQSMRQALGRLWVAGITPKWLALHEGAKRRRAHLPTYPFERERHWVEPEPLDVAPVLAASHPPSPRQPSPVPSRDLAVDASGTNVLERLRTILSHASGHPQETIALSQPFLELGFDSLLLTQVSTTIQKTLGVAVSLRQLVEQLTTLEALASHVQAKLAQNAPPPAAANRNAGVTLPASAANPGVPPVPGARLGRDADGTSSWFVPDPDRPGKYLRVKLPNNG